MRGLLLLCGAIGTIPISYELGYGDIWIWTVALYWPLSFLIAFTRAKSQKGVNLVRFALPIMLATQAKENATWGDVWFKGDDWNDGTGYVQETASLQAGYRWSDLKVLDDIHSWTVFTLQWPFIAMLALLGDEKPRGPVVRVWDDTTNNYLKAVAK